MEGGMTRKNPHIGSTFESWLDEKGLREEVTASAIKSVIAEQIDGRNEIDQQHQYAAQKIKDADRRIASHKRQITDRECRATYYDRGFPIPSF